MATLVGTVGRCGLNKERHRNQPKLALYKPLLTVAVISNSCTYVTRWNYSVIKMGFAYMGAHVSRSLKAELA